jgi:hypothetical protein
VDSIVAVCNGMVSGCAAVLATLALRDLEGDQGLV